MIPQVMAYCWGDEPLEILPARRAGPLHLTAPIARGTFAVGDVMTTKRLGQIGTFEVVVRPYPGAHDLMDLLADGDWIDISWRGQTEYTTLRGIIRRRLPMQSAQGPAWTLYGDDFTGVWDQTTLWFNPLAAEDLGGGITMSALLSAVRDGGATPAAMARVFLERFFREMEVRGRSLGALPPGVPGARASFIDSVRFLVDESVLPKRVAFAPHGISFADQNLWEVARQWSDPQFVELHTDLVHPSGRALRPTDNQSPDNVAMGVILRDRPFPTDADPTGLQPSGVAPGQASASPYWRLVRHEVYLDTNVEMESVSTASEERVNVVGVSPPLGNGIPQHAIAGVLYDGASMRKHGFRRLHADTQYVSQVLGNVAGVTRASRIALRDWYSVAAYLYSGTVSLAELRPEIRCGDRVVVQSARPGRSTSYYVEGVTHVWNGVSGKTTLQVSRGWRGTDQSYLKFLRALQPRWQDTADSRLIVDVNIGAFGSLA